ncbi:tetratricopeptide repeat-containing sensor histidine kinase [Patiriisocius hiemis]|uniref:histidine kinase n=1 Tax=Patiriisocius hiemis TaxID=3075604 RepID=A0ABU2YF07_9FLAO|nr:sensor histidine kinase [Constantimarinum sp. W242]MDT0556776.1 sensor histidine kinase [Constantimarinum sp. W242]
MRKKYLLLFVIFCGNISLYGQVSKDSINSILENTTITDSLRANTLNQVILEHFTDSKPDSAIVLVKKLLDFTSEKKLEPQKADAINTFANSLLHKGEVAEALSKYEESLLLYQKLKDLKGEGIVLNNIGKIYKLRWNFDEAEKYYKQALKKSKEALDTVNEAGTLTNLGNINLTRFKVDQAIPYYLQAIQLCKKINFKKGEGIALLNLGIAYTRKEDYEKSIACYDNARLIALELNNKNNLVHVYEALSSTYFQIKNYNNVIETSKQGLELANQLKRTSLQKDFNYYLYEAYKAKNNYNKALYHYELGIQYLDSLDILETEKRLLQFEFDKQKLKDSIVQVEKDYKTQLAFDKEIEQKQAEKRYLLIGFFGLFVVLSIIIFLVYKNTKKKQQLVEKERQIELQKTEKLLKEQELNTIDAMISGQEKERQRLASELHDSVGATLAAAKLQFEHIQKQKEKGKEIDELYTKTASLLDDAYKEVRTMAHEKNNGVIAKKGLLPAIKNLAKNVSGINNLSVEVVHFGLEKRLENSLEISIFRIIQELVTNIIKHSQATEATISITQHDNSINIIVEDNGVGFSSKNLSFTSGIGLSNVEKRIEQLLGTLEVDSNPGKSTTALIDIPL